MKQVLRRIGTTVMIACLVLLITACGGNESAIQASAQSFVTNLFAGKFQEAMSQTTGEMLSVLKGQEEMLKTLRYQGQVDRFDVLSVNENDDLASVMLRVERTVKWDGQSVPDARTIRLGMISIQEQWYVYQMIDVKQDDLYGN